VAVFVVAPLPDPLYPPKKALFVGGTPRADTITLSPADNLGGIKGTINRARPGTFPPPRPIVVFGQAGHDKRPEGTRQNRWTTVYVSVPAFLVGDGGSDILDARGSKANNVLLGGAGDDTLYAGRGRDLLIGGLGADVLNGNVGGDLLIGGATDFDSNPGALAADLAEWARTDADYNSRVGHLGGSAGGLNDPYFLSAATVHDDGAADSLYGRRGLDWFLSSSGGSAPDSLFNRGSGEIATPV